jgi:hypothetical protein
MAWKDVKQVLEKAEKQGWRIDDRGQRVLCYSPDGVTMVTIHKTDSDWRAIRNTISRLRRGGFDSDA